MEQFDALTAGIIGLDTAEVQARVADAEKELQKVGDAQQGLVHAKFYVKTMKRLVEKGMDFPKKVVVK